MGSGKPSNELTPTERKAYTAFQRRRNRITRKCRQLQADVDAWNAMHPYEEPIVMAYDFEADVEEGTEE